MKELTKQKITFTVKAPVDPEDLENTATKDVQLDVRRPTLKDQNDAQLAFNRKFHEAVQSKAPLRVEINATLANNPNWKAMEEQIKIDMDRLTDEISKAVKRLCDRTNGMSIKDRRSLALDIRKKRADIAELSAERQRADLNTAEAQAENARFNWFVANCTVYSDEGRLYYEPTHEYNEKGEKILVDSVTVYLRAAQSRNSLVSTIATECAKNFGALLYGLDNEYEKRQPENQFLLKYKFVREKDLRLINSDGHLIDDEDNLINEDGYYVDKNERRVDRFGTLLDENGRPVIEELNFDDLPA